MITFTVDLGGYPAGGSVSRRTAVRGIIEQDGKYLLVAGKYGDCKFPGGVKEGEPLVGALAREIREETGYAMKPGSAVAWGVVTERRKGLLADILEMDSHYFFCQVEGPAKEQALDEYEEEYGLRPVWATLRSAWEQNCRAEAEEAARQAQGQEAILWVVRERMVMERLLEEEGG